LSSGMWSRETC